MEHLVSQFTGGEVEFASRFQSQLSWFHGRKVMAEGHEENLLTSWLPGRRKEGREGKGERERKTEWERVKRKGR